MTTRHVLVVDCFEADAVSCSCSVIFLEYAFRFGWILCRGEVLLLFVPVLCVWTHSA